MKKNKTGNLLIKKRRNLFTLFAMATMRNLFNLKDSNHVLNYLMKIDKPIYHPDRMWTKTQFKSAPIISLRRHRIGVPQRRRYADFWMGPRRQMTIVREHNALQIKRPIGSGSMTSTSIDVVMVLFINW